MLIASIYFADQIIEWLTQKISARQKDACSTWRSIWCIVPKEMDIDRTSMKLSKKDLDVLLELCGEVEFISRKKGVCKIWWTKFSRANSRFGSAAWDTLVPFRLWPLSPRKESEGSIKQPYLEVGQAHRWRPTCDCKNKNDEHYNIAVTQVKVYGLIAGFLEEAGCSYERGCPK